MFDTFQRWIGPLLGSVRFADVLDVALVAAFLFALLTWFRRDARRGASRRLVAALALFAAVYLLANAFSMYLVKQLLEILFIIFLVATVVIFQTEIRRMLDRIGSWSFARQAAPSRSDELIDDLTESAAQLAEAKTGALIAIRGSESWDSQLQGGITLDGSLSLPLLFSIFNDDTPGHDGAALLEGDRLTRFAAHLPLASHLPPASEYGGTRHAAALGLAEQTDALVVVVSEERGTISVAEESRITEMETPSDLKKHLRRFWDEHYENDSDTRARWWSRSNIKTGLLSIALASVFWLAFSYRPSITYRTFVVPIEYRNVGEKWGLEGTHGTQARVSLSGSEGDFRLVNPASLTASFDLTNLHPGQNELVLTRENLDLPQGVELYQADPRTIYVTAHRLQAKKLPVRVPTSGALPDSLQLVNVSTEPASIRVLIPKGNGETPAHIETEEIDLSGIKSSRTVALKLVPPDDAHLPNDVPEKVKARLQVQLRGAKSSGSE